MTVPEPTSDARTAPARPVQAWPCQSVCVWRPSGEVWHAETGADLRVFACTACGSEWVRTEPWTPIDARGTVPPEVEVERRVS